MTQGEALDIFVKVINEDKNGYEAAVFMKVGHQMETSVVRINTPQDVPVMLQFSGASDSTEMNISPFFTNASLELQEEAVTKCVAYLESLANNNKERWQL